MGFCGSGGFLRRLPRGGGGRKGSRGESSSF